MNKKMSKSIIIKNGRVYDPKNGIDGDKIQIHIQDGKIVEKVNEKDAKVIDATGMIVFPGGVDIHAHIAGAKVNAGRAFRPEDHKKDPVPKTKFTRSGSGYSVPSTFVTAYRYAQLGYTTVAEPAMPPLKARHTHEEFIDMPIIDKMAFPLFGNNWFVIQYIKDNDIDKLSAYIAWLLEATKGYAVKLVNPGGVESWGWGKNCESLDDHVTYFDVTPRQIIEGLANANEKLGLPHTIHVHANNLGHPGNYSHTIETFKTVEKISPSLGRKNVMHITHLQFNCYGGTGWKDFESAASKVAEYLNSHEHITTDVGQVIFTNTTTMTADGPWEYALHHISGVSGWGAKPGVKWINGQVEAECGSGLVPYIFNPKVAVNAIQWAIGLELLLSVKNKEQVLLTTDHPNGGPFTFYPRIIKWLMDKKSRDILLKEELSPKASSATGLENLDTELTLYELVQCTRSGTAKCLGLPDKGHLGVGAQADICLYKFNPNNGHKGIEIEKAFTNAAYTIKDGKIVVKDGNVVATPLGDTIWTKASVSDDLMKSVIQDIKERWRDHYSINFNNYPVQEAYLPKQKIITTNS